MLSDDWALWQKDSENTGLEIENGGSLHGIGIFFI